MESSSICKYVKKNYKYIYMFIYILYLFGQSFWKIILKHIEVKLILGTVAMI